MRKSVIRTQTGVGNSNPVALDPMENPFTVALAGIVTSGSATWKVQYTLDDIQDPTVTVTWFDHDVLVGQTGNAVSNIVVPVTAVRLAITSGTGTVQLNVLQAGPTT